MADAPPLAEGTLVAGKLRIVRQLGAGGMGAVYEVEHEFTKHRRALKLLHADMLVHPHIVARFLREASAAGRIGNKHIIESFDAGTLESGEPYLVMELLDGETLEARLERHGTLSLEELTDLVGQACDGVQAAHEAGIVHRDLKPENLFVIQKRAGSLVKILDFGISKFDPTITGAHAVTREGSTLGTPFYMSPEQVNGDKELDARADVYALGVILYECASGRRPYEASALPKLSVLIHEGNPTPLAELRPDLPQAFVEVVARAMAKDRDRRFSSARELGDALANFGSSALDVTLEQPAPGSELHRASRRPVSVRVSEPAPVPLPTVRPAAPLAALKGMAPSVPGAAVSVAQEKKGPAVRGVAIAAVVACLAVGSFFALRPHDTARSDTQASPPAAAVAPPPSTPSPPSAAEADTAAHAPPTPVPAVVATPRPTAAPLAPGPSAGTTSAVSAPSAVPSATTKAPPKPAASTRVDQRGLVGDNPF